MGACRQKGRLDEHQQKLIQRMRAKGYTAEFADCTVGQVEGFDSYGFPESHAASFGLPVYVSCWPKRDHPNALLVSCSTASRWGFDAPSQFVRDAREHGVVVRLVDVLHSGRCATLEEVRQGPASSPRWNATFKDPLCAVCLGLSLIHGMREAPAQGLVTARANQPFESVEDLSMCAGLGAHGLQCLSGADALLSLAGLQPGARWKATGVDIRTYHPTKYANMTAMDTSTDLSDRRTHTEVDKLLAEMLKLAAKQHSCVPKRPR